jgi:branched-chain amino acid transport system ATP-binding protein
VAPPLLELRDVVASYGPVKALHGISLTVDEGAIVAVLGANGAGKTTTLRAISHTVRTGGEIRFAGRSLTGRSAESIAGLGIAHVPEGRGLFPELTIVENLRLGAYVRRGSVKSDLERVYEYFPWMGRRRSELAGSLSGGEQQMLALAKAFMQKPRLLLLDEPSLGLAPIIVSEIFNIVRELNHEGMTMLVVEQNAHIALQLAGTAYVLEVGTVALHGPSEELERNESVRRSYLGY